jgi:hypothetical protein
MLGQDAPVLDKVGEVDGGHGVQHREAAPAARPQME